MSEDAESVQSPQLPLLVRRPVLVPGLVVAALALIGTADLPHGFYLFLRAAVVSGAIVVGVICLLADRGWWLAPSIAAFIIWSAIGRLFFNPPQWGWAIADVLVAIFFAIAAFRVPAVNLLPEKNGKPAWNQTWWFITLVCVVIVAVASFVGAHGGFTPPDD